MTSSRLIAAQILLNVVDQGRSLNDELPTRLAEVDIDQQPFVQQLVYGASRYYFALDELIGKIVDKPIKDKERLVHMILAIGIYQLWKLNVAEHAAIHETVATTVESKRQWAKGLVNASLRRFQREKEALLAECRRGDSFPGWLNKRLRQAYPEHYADICAHSNIPAPMSLRINAKRQSPKAWLQIAEQEGIQAHACEHSHVGVTLQSPAPVAMLPGFEQGDVSVQDEAAQLCAQLLPIKDGDRVLDACSAPGGKTGHLLESAQNLELLALDVSAERLHRVQENLDRIGEQAQLIAADAADVEHWWDGKAFNAILLDAPCSGTGVIRRHPDIKLLRKSADISALAKIQQNLLQKLWPTLAPGGHLLYATCSILPDENTQQIEAFVSQVSDVEVIELNLDADVASPMGVQWLPQPNGHDGFFYALLKKTDTADC
ncbi:16S rRNA (cytosine(967)-C(5))-methyltransferase RsmB [Reinekea thalattae]|uniref:16S rRNA (cytosine(967)-C(5))-methyltransferase n=1 Tax=Reinekea thalattae TaxID=2593301 RepID=A0A5C8ZC00_9GAMM|nr:16S rRNA (cytosine(967)-C(5))-methyltransferase RsmB [Reinekea thalattae]TXR54701.1 16S rRNA (cytosine(967)-C(5))-methyltransferase RsmB [Reinekea thalattae]